MLEIFFSFGILVICISYLILGCAGHKRKDSTGPSEMQNTEASGMPADSNVSTEPSNQTQASTDAGSGSKLPMRSESTQQGGADQSLAGYQSQTSEILAGPGEDPMRSSVGSALSRHSNISGGGAIGSRHQGSGVGSVVGGGKSSVGSRLSSTHIGSQHDKFGSTLDSSVGGGGGSRAPGGAASILSMLSKSGQSNIQSTLSSNAASARSGHGSAVHQSTLDSAVSQHSRPGGGRHSSMAQSVLSTSSNMGKSRRNSHVTSSAMGGGRSSAVGSAMASKHSQASAMGSSMHHSNAASGHNGGASRMSSAVSGRPSSTANNLSRQQISSVSVSGSSPISRASGVSSMHSGANSSMQSSSANSSNVNSSAVGSSAPAASATSEMSSHSPSSPSSVHSATKSQTSSKGRGK